MCMTEQSELAYQAMDETAEWGATHVHMPNVIHLRRVHELEPHVMPGNTTGSVFKDFTTFWAGVDWAGVVVRFLALAITVMAVCWGGQELSMVDWSAVSGLMGAVR